MHNRLPVAIPVQPWFKDHSFGGKTVLAAVETMILLAAESLKKYPEIDIRVMENGLFSKFLEVPQESSTLSALVDFAEAGDGRLQTRLLSQVQIGKMRRLKEHGGILFSKSSRSTLKTQKIGPEEPQSSVKQITSEHIYRELVPFGPSYHTLQGKLLISDHGAWGQLKAPNLPFTNPVQELIGSPFPLDGAMHAACVLGQQFVDYPPFPVGFARRIIVNPTQPGGEYMVKVAPVSQTDDEQVFDLVICNTDGEVFEMISELKMRDVTKALR
jgi:hypothetical protein